MLEIPKTTDQQVLRLQDEPIMVDPRQADFSLVPQPYREWLLQRPDFLDGRYAYNPAKVTSGRSAQDEVAAATSYFGWMHREFPQYMTLVSKIMVQPVSVEEENGAVGIVKIRKRNISPMTSECRVAVVIPAKDEEREIYTTLEGYARQVDVAGKTLLPDLFEIDVLVNTCEGESFDRTFDEVMRFRRAFPHLHVNALEVKFEKSWARIGMARKIASDLVLHRSLQRRIFYRKPLFIDQEDADLVWVDPKQLITVIDTFNQHPELDTLTGYQEKYLRYIANVEFIFISRRFWDLMTAQAFSYLQKGRVPVEKRDFHWSRPFTYGVNTAITAEVYSLIGGYDWDAIVGEDLDMGKRVSLLRGKIVDGRFQPELRTLGAMRTRTNSNPRRYLWTLIKDCGNPYTDGNFQNGDLRKVSIGEMLKAVPERYLRLTDENKRFYEKELWFLYESLRKIMPDRQLAELIVRRTLVLMGFKSKDIEVEGNQIHILNTANFSQAMERYRRIKGVPIDEAERK